MTEINGPEFYSSEPIKNLVILLHGWGASGDNLIDVGKAMSKFLPNSLFIAPNAPFRRENYGYQWFSLEDRSEKVIIAGAKNAAIILNNFIDTKLKNLGFSDEQLSLVGFSQGAMLALYTSLRRPNSCSSVVAYSGRLIASSKLSEVRSKPNVCVIHGIDDEVVPFTAFEVAIKTLTDCGINVEGHPLSGLGHSISEKGILLGAEFIKKHF